MDYRAVFQIAAAGMDLEKRRVDVAALNLANMHSSVPAGQAPHAAQRVLAKPLQVNFNRAMGLAEPALLPRDVQVVANAAAPSTRAAAATRSRLFRSASSTSVSSCAS